MNIRGVARKDLDRLASLKEFMMTQDHEDDVKAVCQPSRNVNGVSYVKLKHALPPEVWEVVLRYIRATHDLKNVSLVCTLFKNIVREQLWNCPKLRCGISSQDLIGLSYLPIRAINTYDFGKVGGRGSLVDSYVDAICSFSELSSLKLGGNIDLTYSSIGKIARLTNLKTLIFEKLYAGIAKAFSQLEVLNLETLLIEDLIFTSDIEPLSRSVGKMTSLKKLEIQTNDRGCLFLSRLQRLEELHVRESEISVVGLLELAKIRSLKKIRFVYCDNIRENIGPFKAANTMVEVEIEGDVTDLYDRYSDDDDYLDYDYDESDLPPDFLDHYNELNLSS